MRANNIRSFNVIDSDSDSAGACEFLLMSHPWLYLEVYLFQGKRRHRSKNAIFFLLHVFNAHVEGLSIRFS